MVGRLAEVGTKRVVGTLWRPSDDTWGNVGGLLFLVVGYNWDHGCWDNNFKVLCLNSGKLFSAYYDAHQRPRDPSFVVMICAFEDLNGKPRGPEYLVPA